MSSETEESVPLNRIVKETNELAKKLNKVNFDEKVELFYNPVDYAWPVHKKYLEQFGAGKKTALFLGMNPGPWGMAQTGIPFTDPYIARDWMNLPELEFEPPSNTADERPVEAWNSDRKEASGQRLFGFFRKLYGNLESFFQVGMVFNYCPLVMFDEDYRNLTPEDLLKDDLKKITSLCDPYIEMLVQVYKPDHLIGIGRFAETRFEKILDNSKLPDQPVRYLPHPSPASPIATRDGGDYWRGLVRDLLEDLEIVEHEESKQINS